jgi:hypothetical protein
MVDFCVAPSSCAVAKACVFRSDAQPKPNIPIRFHQSSINFTTAITTPIMPPTEDKRKAARETIDILYEISSLLVC